MAKKRKKYGKMNLSLDQGFYDHLKQLAKNENLCTSTFVKKFLMDNLLKNNRTEVEVNNE